MKWKTRLEVQRKHQQDKEVAEQAFNLQKYRWNDYMKFVAFYSSISWHQIADTTHIHVAGSIHLLAVSKDS